MRRAEARSYLVAAPMYNEQSVARLVVDDLLDALPALGVRFELLIVDDGSTDATPEILRSYGRRISVVRHEPNRGVGAAFTTMLEYARARGHTHFVFQEGSYKVRAAEIAKLIRAAEEDDYDYILGSRFLEPGHAADTPWRRRSLIYPFSRLFALLTGFEVTDITCGPRMVNMAFWNGALNRFSRYHGYQFEHIMTIWLLHHGARYRPLAVQIQYPDERRYSYINYRNIGQIIAPWLRYSLWRTTGLERLRPPWLLGRDVQQVVRCQ
jgi:glycosyltransferase involved in cell wall biosynthesis